MNLNSMLYAKKPGKKMYDSLCVNFRNDFILIRKLFYNEQHISGCLGSDERG